MLDELDRLMKRAYEAGAGRWPTSTRQRPKPTRRRTVTSMPCGKPSGVRTPQDAEPISQPQGPARGNLGVGSVTIILEELGAFSAVRAVGTLASFNRRGGATFRGHALSRTPLTSEHATSREGEDLPRPMFI